ncbi:DUF3574 domain-containing protein [uncultured Albimonas sp.]|uniref:DUF3574 domain-containing protein n=1 Tax=uncultured Albimonas sp. TaxID=1331701 RepID=UPI0030EB953A
MTAGVRRGVGACLALLLWVGMAGAGFAAAPCAEGAVPMARSELFFGTGRAAAPPVSEAEWQAFVDAEITPRFPDGLTHFPASGQWRGADGAVAREGSFVLLLWHAPSAEADAALAEIRALWMRRFDQESVMQVEGLSCVRF